MKRYALNTFLLLAVLSLTLGKERKIANGPISQECEAVTCPQICAERKKPNELRLYDNLPQFECDNEKSGAELKQVDINKCSGQPSAMTQEKASSNDEAQSSPADEGQSGGSAGYGGRSKAGDSRMLYTPNSHRIPPRRQCPVGYEYRNWSCVKSPEYTSWREIPQFRCIGVATCNRGSCSCEPFQPGTYSNNVNYYE